MSKQRALKAAREAHHIANLDLPELKQWMRDFKTRIGGLPYEERDSVWPYLCGYLQATLKQIVDELESKG